MHRSADIPSTDPQRIASRRAILRRCTLVVIALAAFGAWSTGPYVVAELRRLAIDLTQAVNGALPIAHPLLAMTGIAGVVFTGPAHDPESHLRAVSVSGAGAVNWCPGGTAMSAIMSVLDAMQLLPEGATFVQEGLLGTLFHGRIVGRTIVGELPALVTEIEGSAWITGEHTLCLDDDDPLKDGVGAP